MKETSEVPILPKGNNPVGGLKKTLVVTSRKNCKVTATKAMNDAFQTYFHPGVIYAQKTEE